MRSNQGCGSGVDTMTDITLLIAIIGVINLMIAFATLILRIIEVSRSNNGRLGFGLAIDPHTIEP